MDSGGQSKGGMFRDEISQGYLHQEYGEFKV